MIYHVTGTNATITGSIIQGIEEDVVDLKGVITAAEAILAYHVTLMTSSDQRPALLSFIIDANSGKIIKHWNGLHTIEAGHGPGRLCCRLSYRPGKFQYGSLTPNVNFLDMTEII